MSYSAKQSLEIEQSYFLEIASLAFNDLKEELERHDKLIITNITESQASITISSNENKLELKYELVMDDNKTILYSISQYLRNGDMVTKKQELKNGDQILTVSETTAEDIVNDFLNNYRSCDPFAKLTMSSYNEFYDNIVSL